MVKIFICIFYFIFMICYFLLGGILYVYRREYYDIFIIFVRINKYIFYGGGITLFFLSSSVKFIIGNITESSKFFKQINMIFYIVQYINLFIFFAICISVFWVVVFSLKFGVWECQTLDLVFKYCTRKWIKYCWCDSKC